MSANDLEYARGRMEWLADEIWVAHAFQKKILTDMSTYPGLYCLSA